MSDTGDYDSIQEARSAIASGATTMAFYVVSLAEAEADAKIREALGKRAFRSAELAEAAGFEVKIDIQEWHSEKKTEDIIFARWLVVVPPRLDKQLAALVWDDKDGRLEYMLTRSTRHPGWQLTNFDTAGEPWGHREIYGDASEAFDARTTASGTPLPGLVQVVFRDGRTLVRSGARQIMFNPRKKPAKRAPRKTTGARSLVARALR